MPKKKITTAKTPKKKSELITPPKAKVITNEDKVKDVMASGLSSAYGLALTQGATPAGKYKLSPKLGNVDQLPKRKS